jgi:hypothetical protein
VSKIHRFAVLDRRFEFGVLKQRETTLHLSEITEYMFRNVLLAPFSSGSLCRSRSISPRRVVFREGLHCGLGFPECGHLEMRGITRDPTQRIRALE